MNDTVAPVLVHKTPDCRGRFEEVRSRVKVGDKRRTVRHYTCTVCKATVLESAPGALTEFYHQQQFESQMERAAEDAKVDAKAERVIAGVLRSFLPDMKPDLVGEVAEASVEWLRRNYLRIETDHRGISAWRQKWSTHLAPAITEVEDRVQDAMPEVYHPRPGISIWPHVEWRVNEREGHATLTYVPHANAPADVLDRLEYELPASLPPIEGVEVSVEIRRAS